MKHKRITALGAIALLWCLATSPAHAQEALHVHLGQQTVERGYTVPSSDGQLRLGLIPGVLSVPTEVTVTGPLDEALPAPTGFRFVTSQYQYDISQSVPALLARPAYLTFTVTDESLWKRRIAFFNRLTNAWQVLPTQTREGQVGAWIRFPYVRVAVLEEEGSLTSLGLSSRSVAVIDDTTGVVLAKKNGDAPQSIASLSKLMTALVFLDTKPKWTRVITYQKSDERPGARLQIRVGEKLTIRDAFSVMLIGSANNATMAVVHSTGLSEQEFVRRMNAKAVALGLSNTRFFEPTGLNPRNASTADEYALLAREAFRQPWIGRTVKKQTYTFSTINTKRGHTIKNTNELLFKNLGVVAGKTGFIDEAGYCLAIKTAPGPSGRASILVVLGNATSSGRFREMERLITLTKIFR